MKLKAIKYVPSQFYFYGHKNDNQQTAAAPT